MKSITTKTGLLLTALVGGLSLTASAIDTSKLPPPATKTGVTCAVDIQPLFKASCVRCHGTGGRKPRGGIDLSSLAGVLKGGDDGAILKVGDSANSQLVAAISQLDPKSAMPPKQRARRNAAGPGAPGAAMNTNAPAGGTPPRPTPAVPKPLTADEVGLVRAWIDQGAK